MMSLCCTPLHNIVSRINTDIPRARRFALPTTHSTIEWHRAHFCKPQLRVYTRHTFSHYQYMCMSANDRRSHASKKRHTNSRARRIQQFGSLNKKPLGSRRHQQGATAVRMLPHANVCESKRACVRAYLLVSLSWTIHVLRAMWEHADSST